MNLLGRLTKLFGMRPAQTAEAGLDGDLRDWALQLFVGHGIPAMVKNGVIVFDKPLPPISLNVVRASTHDASVNVRLDVRVALSDGRVLIESFAGLGSDRAAAAKDAMQAFIRSSFHVILKALYLPDDPHIEVKQWMIGGKLRTVVDSEALIRGSADHATAALDCLNTFEARLASAALPPGLHWIRMYYAQMNDAPLGGEVLLDNDAWPGLEQDWMALPWPGAAPFYSLRRFLIVWDKTV